MLRMGRSGNHEESATEEAVGQPVKSNVNAGARMGSEGDLARDIKDGRLSGHVGAGTVLNGEISFQAILRIDGELSGKISSNSGTLIVGSAGKIKANIAVAAAMVNGEVTGDIVATERIEIGRTAKVSGNIKAPILVIEEGGFFEGSCSMMKSSSHAVASSSVNSDTVN